MSSKEFAPVSVNGGENQLFLPAHIADEKNLEYMSASELSVNSQEMNAQNEVLGVDGHGSIRVEGHGDSEEVVNAEKLDNSIRDMLDPKNIIDLKASLDHKTQRKNDELNYSVDGRLDKDGMKAKTAKEQREEIKSKLIDSYTQVGVAEGETREVPESVVNEISKNVDLSYEELERRMKKNEDAKAETEETPVEVAEVEEPAVEKTLQEKLADLPDAEKTPVVVAEKAKTREEIYEEDAVSIQSAVVRAREALESGNNDAYLNEVKKIDEIIRDFQGRYTFDEFEYRNAVKDEVAREKTFKELVDEQPEIAEKLLEDGDKVKKDDDTEEMPVVDTRTRRQKIRDRVSPTAIVTSAQSRWIARKSEAEKDGSKELSKRKKVGIFLGALAATGAAIFLAKNGLPGIGGGSSETASRAAAKGLEVTSRGSEGLTTSADTIARAASKAANAVANRPKGGVIFEAMDGANVPTGNAGANLLDQLNPVDARAPWTHVNKVLGTNNSTPDIFSLVEKGKDMGIEFVGKDRSIISVTIDGQTFTDNAHINAAFDLVANG